MFQCLRTVVSYKDEKGLRLRNIFHSYSQNIISWTVGNSVLGYNKTELICKEHLIHKNCNLILILRNCRNILVKSVSFLSTQRYASAGTSYGPVSVSVSVCLSLCLSQVGVLSKGVDGLICFLAWRLHRLHCV